MRDKNYVFKARHLKKLKYFIFQNKTKKIQ